MHSVVDMVNIGSGTWSVVYTVPVRVGCCGLKDERHIVIIKSKSKPTKKRIDNEINNKRKRV